MLMGANTHAVGLPEMPSPCRHLQQIVVLVMQWRVAFRYGYMAVSDDHCIGGDDLEER